MTNLFTNTRSIEAIATLELAIENGSIYNVDFVTVKEALNRDMEKVYHAAVGPFFWSGAWENLPKVVRDELDTLNNPQCHTLKAYTRRVNKAAKANPEHALVIVAQEILAEVTPVIEKFQTVKAGEVIKGRKPSTDPRKTPERTLENTGTCAVCGRNVKLSGGKIVDHGYTIKYGFQSGNCAGVNYDAIEISPDGAIAYLKTLEAYKIAQEYALGVATAAAVGATDRKIKYAPMNIESMIRMVTRDIETFTTIITTWEAKALPGQEAA